MRENRSEITIKVDLLNSNFKLSLDKQVKHSTELREIKEIIEKKKEEEVLIKLAQIDHKISTSVQSEVIMDKLDTLGTLNYNLNRVTKIEDTLDIVAMKSQN
jgi:hypothetical protein